MVDVDCILLCVIFWWAVAIEVIHGKRQTTTRRIWWHFGRYLTFLDVCKFAVIMEADDIGNSGIFGGLICISSTLDFSIVHITKNIRGLTHFGYLKAENVPPLYANLCADKLLLGSITQYTQKWKINVCRMLNENS